MKKLFFIVLTVVVLMVAGSYVKEILQTKIDSQTEENVVEVVEGCDCNAERSCAESDAECLEKMVACGCDADEDDGLAEEVEELNPELTSDEDETIVSE